MDEYEFPGMTPELRAYLARGDDYRQLANESWKLIEAAQAACKLADNDSEVVKAYEEAKSKHYASLRAHAAGEKVVEEVFEEAAVWKRV